MRVVEVQTLDGKPVDSEEYLREMNVYYDESLDITVTRASSARHFDFPYQGTLTVRRGDRTIVELKEDEEGDLERSAMLWDEYKLTEVEDVE